MSQIYLDCIIQVLGAFFYLDGMGICSHYAHYGSSFWQLVQNQDKYNRSVIFYPYQQLKKILFFL